MKSGLRVEAEMFGQFDGFVDGGVGGIRSSQKIW